MGAVRMNITLPEKTADKLKKQIKPRERSQVIAEALEMYFKKSKKEKLVKDLVDAYSESAKEDLDDQALWNGTLNDGLDDETW